jgi:hypothetical protein
MSDRARRLLASAHFQDVTMARVFDKEKRLRKAFEKVRGGVGYVDINLTENTPAVHNKLKALSKEYKVKLYNLFSPKTHQDIEDKVQMAKMMGRYGAGRTIPLKGLTASEIRGELARNKDMFIKMRVGSAGEGVQSPVAKLSNRKIKRIIKHTDQGKQYVLQQYQPMKELPSGDPFEYRVHTVGGKVLDMTGRHGVGMQLLDPRIRSQVKEHVQKAVRHIQRKNTNLKNTILGFDVGITQGGKPVIHEFQGESGFMLIPGVNSFSSAVSATGAGDLASKRIAKRLGAIAGLGAVGTAGTFGIEHARNKWGKTKDEVKRKPLVA